MYVHALSNKQMPPLQIEEKRTQKNPNPTVERKTRQSEDGCIKIRKRSSLSQFQETNKVSYVVMVISPHNKNYMQIKINAKLFAYVYAMISTWQILMLTCQMLCQPVR